MIVMVQMLHFYGCYKYAIDVDSTCPTTKPPSERAIHLTVSSIFVAFADTIESYGVCDLL